ncbi:DUF7382 domain-containing protein [Natranaeroarchaeum aerophilus]|uniref:Carboxypeptidase regulatory-like domain-containing protein n=1 Tax=Natranaeroarchaeum aerophilus TaxID=2917711 RepID=A0AAE3FPF7_9EURY|nr:carboxypeptidase regulatory-like domain-containing protein [Natranaeroarchaeum aerophilus]MCL9812814.1 carboxypeptidase regulatory-like domain-containing protein [Natranaeroarchaeum aerophilus]
MRLEAFRSDDRAIEGLPIRLVIAIVVGVASLSIMMSMLSGVGTLGTTELDVEPDEEVIETGYNSVDLTVIDDQGDPVEGATVIVSSGTANIDGVVNEESDADGEATVGISPELRDNQDKGTLEIDINPPAGTEYEDQRENTELLVIDD